MAKTSDFSPAAAILQEAIAQRVFPGCTIVAGNDREILWSAAFGHFDYENGMSVTSDTIYDLASLSKVIGTTSVLMRLDAEGKLDTTAPASQYLPEFIEAGPEKERDARREITVSQLLHHQAGLPSWKPFYRTHDSYPALLQAVIETPLDTAPGTRYRYSDLGFMLLGEIAARAGGKPLAELERELVFTPLQMNDTLRNPPAELLPRIPPTEKWPDRDGFVHGVVHDENARAGGGITGHAGLFATAEDLARLARELLLATAGKSELFPRAVAERFTRRASPDFHRALGWALSSGNGSAGTKMSSAAFGHTGFTGTSIWIDPEKKLYVILLTNRVHPTRNTTGIGRVRAEVADAIVRAVDSSR